MMKKNMILYTLYPTVLDIAPHTEYVCCEATEEKQSDTENSHMEPLDLCGINSDKNEMVANGSDSSGGSVFIMPFVILPFFYFSFFLLCLFSMVFDKNSQTLLM